MAELEHLGGKRAESARMRRAEQLRRWRGSLTEQEPAERQPPTRRGSPRVRFEDGAVFLAACSSGDTDEVRKLLARGADINTVNVDGLTALHQVTPFSGSGSRSPRPREPPPWTVLGSPSSPSVRILSLWATWFHSWLPFLPLTRTPGSLREGLGSPRRLVSVCISLRLLYSGCHGYWRSGPGVIPTLYISHLLFHPVGVPVPVHIFLCPFQKIQFPSYSCDPP